MPKKFIVACGGTGGHAFPGLAVARELRARGHEVVVWDSGRSIEGSVMKSWDGAVFSTGARPLSLKNAPANLFAFLRCRREMRRMRPDGLLAMGSYSSLPPVLAAAVCRVPVTLHEANTIPGRAVEFLSRFARTVAISFPETARHLTGRETQLTGLPVRAEIAGQSRFAEFDGNVFTVFVTGGSQGAHAVNELASRAFTLVKQMLSAEPSLPELRVIHQTGFADEGAIMRHYASAGIPARVCAFEREMGRAFATADLVICRAGASTCFELALVGKPAFFIPLPSAMRNHQHFNAESFVAAGAADEGRQDVLTPAALANYVVRRIRNREEFARMAGNMKKLAGPDAAARVAALVEKNVS